ncbi:MAG: hypothetical protein FRX49_12236 [Trebouxia sp. A1-2]|nr:MAG: hypothetical protein FRX49_12236 [Trebouxia sp. A1-2]
MKDQQEQHKAARAKGQAWQPKGKPTSNQPAHPLLQLAPACHSHQTAWAVKTANSEATAGKQEAWAKKERGACQLFSAFCWNLTRTAMVHRSRSDGTAWHMILPADSMGIKDSNRQKKKRERGKATCICCCSWCMLLSPWAIKGQPQAKEEGWLILSLAWVIKDDNSHKLRKSRGGKGKRPVGINLLDSKADAVLAAGLRDHDDVHVGVSYSTEEGAGCSWHPHHAGSLHAPSSAIRAQTLVPFSFLNRTDRQTDRHTDRRTGSGRPDKPEPW